MNLLFVDCETLGLDSKNQSLIQIAAVHYKDGVKGETFNRKLKPIKAGVQLGALVVNKVPYDKLMSFDDPFSVLKDFLAYILRLPNGKDTPLYIAGHNVAFDVEFIKQLLADFNVTEWERVFKASLIDTAGLALNLQDAGIVDKFNITLGALANNLGVEVDEKLLHDANEDVRITAECYFKMQDRLKNLLNQANK